MLAQKKLLFVDNDVRTFISHRLALARRGVTLGLDVHLAAPASQSALQLAEYGISYHEIPLTRSGMAPWIEVKTVLALLQLYRSLRPDIVHHLRVKPVLYGGIAARISGISVVVSALTGLGHLFRTRTLSGRSARALVLLGLRVALGSSQQRVIFQNPDDRDYCVGRGLCPIRKTVVIRGSGVDTSEFTPVHEPLEPPPIVVLPSRLLWEKGIGEFVGAAMTLKNEGIVARFALVGDPDPGNPSSVSVGQLRAWSADGIVEWWGWRRDMPEVLREAHIVCLPTFYGEGVPRVLIEAAASSRPIVTTDTPGCREIVRHGINGFLVPERDIPALANALRVLLTHSELRRSLGQNGRQIAVTEFSIQKVIQDTFEVYGHLIASVSA